MRRLLWVLLILVLVPRTPAYAQQGSLPNLVFTFFGGTYTGHDLWRVDRQPLRVLGTSGPSALYDTLQLARRVGAGLAVGLTANYYWSDRAGVQTEIGLIGLSLDNTCTGLLYNPEPQMIDEQKNAQMCNSMNGSGGGFSAISGTVGLIYRVGGRRALSPFARAGIGFLAYSRGTVAAFGAFATTNTGWCGAAVCARDVIVDDDPLGTSFNLSVGAGFNSALGGAYLFRFEVTDVLSKFERVAGPANGLGQAPTSRRFYHHIGVTLGIGIILEKQRGRRY